MKYLIKNKYWEINKEYNLDKLLYLLIDRANRSNRSGEISWYNNKGLFCRNYDLPSFVSSAADISWWKSGKTYRKNKKPYIIWDNGIKE